MMHVMRSPAICRTASSTRQATSVLKTARLVTSASSTSWTPTTSENPTSWTSTTWNSFDSNAQKHHGTHATTALEASVRAAGGLPTFQMIGPFTTSTDHRTRDNDAMRAALREEVLACQRTPEETRAVARAAAAPPTPFLGWALPAEVPRPAPRMPPGPVFVDPCI